MGGGGGGGQGRCERRSEAFVKIQKKIFFLAGGKGGGGSGGCELRSEAFVKIRKKKFFFWGGGGGSGRGGSGGGGVNVNGEVKLIVKIQNSKNIFGAPPKKKNIF